MAPEMMSSLLKLSADERADLALALWASLEDSDRESAVALTPTQIAELERRLSEHLADPSTAIPWSEVRKKLAE